MSLPPLSLYVHLPWCVQKCPYCDFNSHTAGAAAPRQRYLEALLVDLEEEASRGEGRKLESIFLGGGTPSLFSPDEIGRLLDGIRACFDISDNAEITMEANPGTVECGEPGGYRDAGINRLSFGGQSFNDELLKKIGRIHNSEEIVRAVNDAQAAGVDNVNIDLMHGLPGQDVAAALEDLETAIGLMPAHISWYQLTLEPNTVFHARPPGDLPDEETFHMIQDRGQTLLAESGYRQYEVSAFARDDMVCAHNLNYWLFGDYLAAGAGAHGKISSALGVFRYQKPANPLQYMKTVKSREPGPPPVQVAGTELVFEFMLNALRLSDGFSDAIFCERTGLTADELEAAMRGVCEKGLVARADLSRWQATTLGKRFLNDLQAEFLPDKP